MSAPRLCTVSGTEPRTILGVWPSHSVRALGWCAADNLDAVPSRVMEVAVKRWRTLRYMLYARA